MIQKVSLKAVVLQIFSGVSFRNKITHDPTGDLWVVQMKDLIENYSSITSDLTCIKGERINRRLFLQPHDVLFIAKGANNYAIEFTVKLPNVVAASAFFVLRPDTTKIIPAYLSWYINQQPLQEYFRENMAGTYVPNINKKTIEDSIISLPELDIQKKVVATYNLFKREQMLTRQLLQKREEVVNTALLTLTNANQ